jgi:hypothetical protein
MATIEVLLIEFCKERSMLSSVEKDHLYNVIAAILGEDSSIKACKSSFNETKYRDSHRLGWSKAIRNQMVISNATAFTVTFK